MNFCRERTQFGCQLKIQLSFKKQEDNGAPPPLPPLLIPSTFNYAKCKEFLSPQVPGKPLACRMVPDLHYKECVELPYDSRKELVINEISLLFQRSPVRTLFSFKPLFFFCNIFGGSRIHGLVAASKNDKKPALRPTMHLSTFQNIQYKNKMW